MKKSNIRKYIINLTPLFGLVALLIAFLAIGTVQDINIT